MKKNKTSRFVCAFESEDENSSRKSRNNNHLFAIKSTIRQLLNLYQKTLA